MPHAIKNLVLLLFAIAAAEVGYGQIAANPTNGCAPLTVSFSAPNGSTNWSWDFGNGASAGIKAPNATYTSPGNYTVTFSGSVGGSPVQETITIEVYGKPEPSFTTTTPEEGCSPLTVSFEDNSTALGGASIVDREWTFGDGGTNQNNDPTPSYTYTLLGQFDVSLLITDDNGCDSIVTLSDFVTTSLPPTVSLSTTPSSATVCEAPSDIDFSAAGTTSNSPLGNQLTFDWDFGNGSTSNVEIPGSITYDTVGSFTATLTVTDENNCSRVTTKQVLIDNPKASFTFPHDTICGTINFTNVSSNGSYSWDFGDGATSTTGSPSHTYQGPGSYDVTLTVTSGTCSDDTTVTIVVEEIVADFSSNPNYSCEVPFNVQYTDLSTNAVDWEWTFANGTVVNGVQNPLITYVISDTNQYTIFEEETFVTSLTVTSPIGCRATKQITAIDTVFLPTAIFMPDISEGCLPLAVTFTDFSVSKERVTNRTWDFGDGTVVNGNDSIITHTYTTAGEFNVMLEITNSKGCTDTSYFIEIEVGDEASPNFSVNQTTICVGDSVQFTDLTPLSDSIDTWHYETDDKLAWSCQGDPNPIWAFGSDTGFMDVTLTVAYNGCYSDTTISDLVKVNGPLVEANHSCTCDSAFVINVDAAVKGANRWVWDFGDGTPVIEDSVKTAFRHEYAARGDYDVVLTGFNDTNSCAAYRDTILVKIRDIQANLNMDSIFCNGATVTMNAGSSQDVNAYCNKGYRWDLGYDTPPIISDNGSESHLFQTNGNTAVRLIVQDENGCTDTAFQNISVYTIDADFATDEKIGCLPFTVNFSDSTRSDTGLFSWNWSFGDNSTSSIQNPSHTYTSAGTGTFDITMEVTDSLGCTDSFTRQITISQPDPTFSATTSREICVGDSVNFSAVAPANEYRWNFGDNTELVDQANTWHAYDSAGIFSVELVITDSISCKDSSTVNNFINVQSYPQAGFSSDQDSLDVLCYPLVINFIDTTNYGTFGSRVWDLGQGGPTVPDDTVGTSYDTPDIYEVSLITTTSHGCSDTVTKNYNVVGPVANFSLSPSLICRGESITFEINSDSTDVWTFGWDFGDGFDTTAISPVSHRYDFHPPGGSTIATLIYWSEDSVCSASTSKPVSIHQVIADFDRNDEGAVATDTAHCIGGFDVFTDKSQDADSWNWDFDNGNTFNGQDPPPQEYTAGGTYNIVLTIADNQTGCRDTIEKELIIYPFPDVVAMGDDTCVGESVQIFASGGESYVWTPANNLSDDSIANPIANPSISTDYTVQVTDSNNCVKDTTVRVTIYQEPPSVIWDTTVIIGEHVQLNGAFGSEYTYAWAPDTGLSCADCPVPNFQAFEDIVYELTISDTVGCFQTLSTYTINVDSLFRVRVPSAFTPGVTPNDIVYARGWGIDELLEFNIYNRWGELVYENPGDLNHGWDGTYKGKPQNSDTYVYTIKVLYYKNLEPITENSKGTITLLR